MNTFVLQATQDDPRPAFAVKKKNQWTAPTPWQRSTLTHLLTTSNKSKQQHTHSLQPYPTNFTSHDLSTDLCQPVLHALVPKRCGSICCHHRRPLILGSLLHETQVQKVVAAC